MVLSERRLSVWTLVSHARTGAECAQGRSLALRIQLTAGKLPPDTSGWWRTSGTKGLGAKALTWLVRVGPRSPPNMFPLFQLNHRFYWRGDLAVLLMHLLHRITCERVDPYHHYSGRQHERKSLQNSKSSHLLLKGPSILSIHRLHISSAGGYQD